MLYFQCWPLLNALKRERKETVHYNSFSIKWSNTTQEIPFLQLLIKTSKGRKSMEGQIYNISKNRRSLNNRYFLKENNMSKSSKENNNISKAKKNNFQVKKDNSQGKILMTTQYTTMGITIMEMRQLITKGWSSTNSINFGEKMSLSMNTDRMFSFMMRMRFNFSLYNSKSQQQMPNTSIYHGPKQQIPQPFAFLSDQYISSSLLEQQMPCFSVIFMFF